MSEITVHARRSFPYSRDGHSILYAAEGKDIIIPERLADGLEAAGYILREADRAAISVSTPGVLDSMEAAAEAPNAETADSGSIVEVSNGQATVVEPAPKPAAKTSPLSQNEEALLASGKWKSAAFAVRRSMAAKLSDQPVNTSAEANAVIEVEIVKRVV